MFAKLVEGKPEPFDGNMLECTIEDKGKTYHVYAVNPSEELLNKAGYYAIDPAILADVDNAAYVVQNNAIVKAENYNNEETPVQ